MKNIALVLFLLVLTNAENKRIISFTQNPFENTFMEEKWNSPGKQPWQWEKSQPYIRSSYISALQSSSCEFNFSADEGYIEISFLANLRGKEQVFTISLDNKQKKSFTGIQDTKIRFKTSLGPHTLRFLFRKVARSRGGGYCTINKISYKPIIKDILDYTIHHSDEKSDVSWGNNDKIAQSFEMVSIFIPVKSMRDINKLQYKIELPQNIVGIVHSKTAWKAKKDKTTTVHFSLLANGHFRKDQMNIKIIFISYGVTLAKIQYSIPFEYIDPARAFLEKETVIKSKKFDFYSAQQLDVFLQQFPKSELTPIIFSLRLECCRKVRDESLAKNQDQTSDREKNILHAINSYLAFIEKYPERLLTKIAIHELFQLYIEMNRISFYYNFIERFPHSEQSIVAREHIKALMYKVVCTKNTIEAYDNFIEMYPGSSFFTEKCSQFALQKALNKEEILIQDFTQKITTKDKYIQQLITQSSRTKRANELINKWLNLTSQLKNMSNNNQRFITGARIQRIKTILVRIYQDTSAISTLLIMEKLEEITKINKEIKNLQLSLHKKNLQRLEHYFSTLQQHLDKNFATTNKKITTLHQSVKDLKKNLQLIHIDISTKLSVVDQKITTGFASIHHRLKNIQQKLDVHSDTTTKYLMLLHYNLDNVNQQIIDTNSNIVSLSKNNDDFMRQHLNLLKAVQQNGKILDGWQKYKGNSSLKTAVSKTVVNFIGETIQSIPVIGPITKRLTAPFIKWIGDKAGDQATSLWASIF